MPVVFSNSPNLSPYFSLNKFERIWLLICSSWLCLINSHFLITKCHISYVIYIHWLALKGLKWRFMMTKKFHCLFKFFCLLFSKKMNFEAWARKEFPLLHWFIPQCVCIGLPRCEIPDFSSQSWLQKQRLYLHILRF